MNGKQLKNSILQWAIQGKLVPQDPNDEPASVLFEKIRAEKARLVKEGKLKKKDLDVKPIAEDEIPFEIPESWEWCRLKDLVTFIGGYAYDSQSFISLSEYQVLRLGNIKNDLILLDVNPVFIPQELAEYTQRFKCKLGDILITMTGTRKKRDYFYSVLIGEKQKDLFVNQRVGCLRAYEKQVSNWLIKAIKTETVLQEVFQYETGTANQGNLGAENILNVLVPLPPLPEQHRIVAKIEELMPLVEKYGAAQETLDDWNQALPEKLKKSILQEAIQGKLVPQDPADEPASVLLERIREEKKRLVKEGKLKKKDVEGSTIFRGDDNKYYEQINGEVLQIEIDIDFPVTWEVARLSQICRLSDGEKKEGEYVCLDAKFLRGKTSGVILPQGKYVSEGDNIILVDGENSGEVFTAPCNGYMGSTFKQLWVSAEMHLPFVLHFIQSHKDHLRNSKKGAAIPHLNKDIFYNLLIGLPPIEEQARISDKIEELYSHLQFAK